MEDKSIKLNIQSVTQKAQTSFVTTKNPNFVKDLKKKVVEQQQETLPDGKIKITVVIDPEK